MTNPMNYNQQLLSYLQAWRQLLEASAALTSGMPMGASPMGMPPMPPTPFMPPMTAPGTTPPGSSPPTDYSQQLFGYLQAWRQYLEQAIGTAPGMAMPPPGFPGGAPSTPTQPTAAQATEPPAADAPPTGSQSSFGAENEDRVVLRPRDPIGTITDLKSIRGLESGSGGSAFAAKLTSADSSTPPPGSPGATRSLFSGRSRNAPAPAAASRVSQDPRRAAPPATSRWWEAGRGVRPGFSDKPEAKNLKRLRPTDLGGKEQ